MWEKIKKGGGAGFVGVPYRSTKSRKGVLLSVRPNTRRGGLNIRKEK